MNLAEQLRPSRRHAEPAPVRLALSYGDAADAIGVSPRTLQRLVSDGRIRPSKISAQRRVIAVAELQRFLEQTAESGAVDSGGNPQ